MIQASRYRAIRIRVRNRNTAIVKAILATDFNSDGLANNAASELPRQL